MSKSLWIGVAVVEENDGWPNIVINPLVFAGFRESEGDVLVEIKRLANGRKICYQHAKQWADPSAKGQDIQLIVNELGHIVIKETT